MSAVTDSPASLAPPISRSGWLRLTPLDRRRLDSFKANRRGYWSFWLFTILFVMSLLSNILANDRPVLAFYKGELLFPAFVNYPEEKFGGFLARTDYRDPVIEGEINSHGWMIWPPIPYSYDTVAKGDGRQALQPPSWRHLLGTDDQARDVMARLIYGFRISVLFGLALTLLSSVVGIVAGAVQGYFGGLVDLSIQRFMEIWSSMPTLYLQIGRAHV